MVRHTGSTYQLATIACSLTLWSTTVYFKHTGQNKEGGTPCTSSIENIYQWISYGVCHDQPWLATNCKSTETYLLWILPLSTGSVTCISLMWCLQPTTNVYIFYRSHIEQHCDIISNSFYCHNINKSSANILAMHVQTTKTIINSDSANEYKTNRFSCGKGGQPSLKLSDNF